MQRTVLVELDGRVDVAALLVQALPGAEPEARAAAERWYPNELLPGEGSGISVTWTDVDGRTQVQLTATSDLHIPFWQWAFRPVVRIEQRRQLRHLAATLRAVATGAAPPRVPRAMAGLPTVRFDAAQVNVLACAAAASALAGFGGALFGQNVDFVADAYGSGNEGLGVALAITRFGVLLSLVTTALADRRGRRRLLLVSVVGLCVANLAASVAPNLASFTATQIVARGFVQSTFAVAGVLAIEEAPEGARAFAVGMMGLAGGFGFSFAVLALPLGDLGTEAFRISFLLGGLSVVFVPRIARRLPESRRYTSLVDTGVRRGDLRRLRDPLLFRRLVLLGIVAFATNLFTAPASQLTNRFLGDERGFSGLDITVFRTVTTALPGLIGLVLAIVVVEGRGRRPTAVVGLLVATATEMVFFLSDGPLLWLSSGVALLVAAIGGLAIGTLTAELFPTEVRATANALLLVLAVLGAATGLIGAGLLADPLDGLGRAIALLGTASLVVAVLVVPRLPEPKGRRLDEVSPVALTPPGL